MDTEKAIESLFQTGDPKHFELRRAFTPELHGVVMRRFEANHGASSEAFRNYLQDLQWIEVDGRGSRGLRYEASEFVVELVALWERHAASQADAAPHKPFLACDYLLEAGRDAALRRFRIEDALRWKREAERRRPPKTGAKQPGKHKNASLRFEDGFPCGCVGCVEKWQRAESGAMRAQAEALLAKDPSSWAVEEVGLLSWVFAWGAFPRPLFSWRGRGYWLAHRRNRPELFYLDGAHTRPPAFEAVAWPEDDVRFVAGATRCDERALVREGRHGYACAQRYDANVLFMRGEYQPTRDEAMMSEVVWLCLSTEAEAREVQAALIAARGKKAKAHPGVQGVLRSYADQTELGVRGSDWVSSRSTVRSWASPEQAEDAYEAFELEQLHKGNVLYSLRFLDT